MSDETVSPYGFQYELAVSQAEEGLQRYRSSGMQDIGALANSALMTYHAIEWLLPTIERKIIARFHLPRHLEETYKKKNQVEIDV